MKDPDYGESNVHEICDNVLLYTQLSILFPSIIWDIINRSIKAKTKLCTNRKTKKDAQKEGNNEDLDK